MIREISESEINFIPDVDSLYIPTENSIELEQIINSKMFYPVFISGLSGNGKTLSIIQACAKNNREMFRVNITSETDEDDLFGGFRLVNGETVWFDGPVIQAMKHGAVLLLDEVDLGTYKILCLQPVLEGNGVLLKKINKFIKPESGFNVIATANTKGKGSDDGRFVGTNILNEAFLERFSITFEQDYPSQNQEISILTKLFDSLGISDIEKYVENLAKWADCIRKTYFDGSGEGGGVDELISTRRLTHIAKAYSIFRDELKAVTLCINRFDQDTKESFLDIWKKISDDEPIVEEQKKTEEDKLPKFGIFKATFD